MVRFSFLIKRKDPSTQIRFKGMAGTKGEEAIVEGHEEIGGSKRAKDDKDAHLAKRAKVESKEALDCRNLVEKEEGEAAGNNRRKEEEEEEVMMNNKVGRLRGLLEDDPRRLRNKDVEDVVHYLEVDEIMRLAMKSKEAKGIPIEDYGYAEEADFLVPSSGKVLGLLTLMLVCGIEKLKEGDLFILYQNFPKLAFAQLLLSALGSSNSVFDMAEEERVMISRLCYALPWKLFAHIMYHKTSLPQFKRSDEEEKEECCTRVEKKAAESCEICYGKGKHSGVYGYHCSFWDCVPAGLTVGPSHLVQCRDCCLIIPNLFYKCHCGSRIGQAVPRSVLWKI